MSWPGNMGDPGD